MSLAKIDAFLKNGSAEFLCHEIDNPDNKKRIPIEHIAEPGLTAEQISNLMSEFGQIVGLSEFYQKYSCLELFHDPNTGDSAYYVAPPDEWGELSGFFKEWIKDIDPDSEDGKYLPPWIGTCCAVGERPGTGSYYLLVTEGEFAGYIFEFDHDGFVFTEMGADFLSFVMCLTTIDEDSLRNIASALRFIESDSPMIQWEIYGYQDSGVMVNSNEEGSDYKLSIEYTENLYSSNEKTTKVATFEFPSNDAGGCTGVDHTEVKLPNEDVIVVVCEVSASGSSLTVSEPGDSYFNGARIGGNSWFCINSEAGFSIQYRIDGSTEMNFSLSK